MRHRLFTSRLKTTSLIRNFASTSRVEPGSFTSSIVSPVTIKDQRFNFRSIDGTPSQKYSRGFYRSSHVIAEATVDEVDTGGNNIAKSVEQVCKVVSENPNSSIEDSLDRASVEVSPVLVVEVLKRLKYAGSVALAFFSWAEKQQGFQHSTESYNALIDALGKTKMFAEIWNLVSDMKNKQLLTRDTFALISRRYSKAKMAKEALETIEKMEKFGMTAEISDYNKLMTNLCLSRQYQSAQELFDKMRDRNFVDDVTYTIAVNAYCKARKHDAAINLFGEMEKKGFKPTCHVFGSLIYSLGCHKRLVEALKFFEKCKASGCVPDTAIYNALVVAYCRSSQMKDAYKLLDEMKKCGVGPTSRTYDIIILHLIRDRRTGEAHSVFQKMNRVEPTLSTYEIMVRMFCNEGQVDNALKIWNQMKAKGFLPSGDIFATLINSLLAENKLDDSCQYFQEMLEMGIRPPSQLFDRLKQALLNKGKMDTAQNLVIKVEKMRPF